jgi:uncharacterized protein YdiU (UPF0061 family)
VIEDSRNLENLADRAYVMQIVALCLPNSMTGQRTKLLSEARAAIDGIPSELDRVDHYLGLAEDLHGIDNSQCRELVGAAAAVLAKSMEDISSYQRRLVDLAFRIDETMAKTLIDLFDDDEAKQAAHRQMRLLEVRKNLGSEQPNAPLHRLH